MKMMQNLFIFNIYKHIPLRFIHLITTNIKFNFINQPTNLAKMELLANK
jgi:hypothetical protein